MPARVLAFTFLVAALAALPACKSSGTAPNPPTAATTRASYMVIGDVESASILSFAGTANGSVAPTYDITGAATGISEPYDVFVNEKQGLIWDGDYGAGTVEAFSLTATGNASPTVEIGPGGSTTLSGPTGVYVNSSGVIYVADYNASQIDVFAADSSGSSVAPMQIITSTDLVAPEELTLDKNGNIWTTSGTYYPVPQAVVEFSASAGSNATPTAEITGSNTGLEDPTGLDIDSHGNIWVTNCTGSTSTASIEEFAAGSNGNVAPERTIAGTGTDQECPYGVAVDGEGYIYEAETEKGAVNVFAPSATGNVAPLQELLSGSTTKLSEPAGITVY